MIADDCRLTDNGRRMRRPYSIVAALSFRPGDVGARHASPAN